MKNLIVVIALASAGFFQGCASAALNTKIDRELAQESAVKSRTDLRKEAGQLIQTTPGLTADQRSKLSSLRDTTRAQLDAMAGQSLKLRSVLLKTLVAANYNDDEVELIKQRIKDLEEKRLTVTFNAVEQANQILGHETEANRQRIMDEFFETRAGRWEP